MATAKLNYIISSRNFEAIRDQIATIIKVELVRQYQLTNNAMFNCDVWINRNIIISEAEYPCVNVLYAGTKFQNQDQFTKTGESTFYIDVHTATKSSSTDNTGKNSMHDCQKLIGVIDYILSAIEYKGLDLTPKIIQHTEANSVDIALQQKTGDSMNICYGRLTFVVRANESVAIIPALISESTEVTVKLEQTNIGYKIKTINT